MKKLLVTLTKPTKFGFTEIVHLARLMHAQGGITFYYRKTYKWNDGHTTLQDYSDIPDREYANDMYKRFLASGYKEESREEFTPFEMDMR